jgi:WD40 repeat protein
MPSGKTLEPIKGEAGVNVIAYSADGETLACACQDGTVALWNVRNRTFSRLGNAKKPVLSLAWSPDDKLLASADEAGLVSLWDPARGKRVRSVPHPRPVRDVAFSPDGKLLAWPVGNLIHFYEVANWKQREEVAGHTTRLQDLAFSPDGKVLASGAFKDPALRLWDVTTGKELHRLVDGKGGVFTCLFSPDGKTLVASPFSGGFDPDLRLWDPATGKLKGKLAGPTSMVTCLAYSPDGKWLASGESVRILRLWDMASQKQIRQWSGPVPGQRWTGPNTLTFTPEGNELISTGHGEPICVWDPQTGKLERTFEGGAMRVKSVALSPSGRTLATSTSTSYFLVWERATGKQITRIGKHDSKIFDLAVSPDGRRIASGSGDRTVRIWDLASGKEIQRFSGGSVVSTLAYSPDGTTLAVGMWDGTILLYDVSPPEKPEPDHLTGTQLQELWTDLLAHDPGKAYRAVWALRSAPRQAIPFLREQLTSPARTDDARVARLIAQLDDDQFVVRNRATQALKEMGPVADEALRRALRETKSVEVRIRIQRLLAGRGESGYPVQRLRTLRALDVLEQVGGKDAQEVLAELSKKGGTAWLRSEAGQGLKRLEARGNEGRWR